MKVLTTKILMALVSGLVVASGVSAQTEIPVETHDQGDSVKQIVWARPFQLEVPHKYGWNREKPEITEGLLLVLKVDGKLARPRQVGMPVLFAGTVPVQRTNAGFESGHVVVIVPGRPDLKKTVFYFGSAELPERIDADRGREELASAQEVGCRPFAAKAIEKVLPPETEPLQVKNIVDLFYEVSDLILRYAPDEVELAERYRRTPVK